MRLTKTLAIALETVGCLVILTGIIIELAKNGINGDVEYIYWIEWDDMPGIPVAITDDRVEPVEH